MSQYGDFPLPCRTSSLVTWGNCLIPTSSEGFFLRITWGNCIYCSFFRTCSLSGQRGAPNGGTNVLRLYYRTVRIRVLSIHIQRGASRPPTTLVGGSYTSGYIDVGLQLKRTSETGVSLHVSYVGLHKSKNLIGGPGLPSRHVRGASAVALKLRRVFSPPDNVGLRHYVLRLLTWGYAQYACALLRGAWC